MGWKTNTKTVKYKTFLLCLCSKKVEIVSMEKGSTRCAGSWYWVKSEEIGYLKYGISKADKARLLRRGYSLVYKWDIRVHVLLTRGAYVLTNNHSNQNQLLIAERAWRPAVKMMISMAYLREEEEKQNSPVAIDNPKSYQSTHSEKYESLRSVPASRSTPSRLM